MTSRQSSRPPPPPPSSASPPRPSSLHSRLLAARRKERERRGGGKGGSSDGDPARRGAGSRSEAEEGARSDGDGSFNDGPQHPTPSLEPYACRLERFELFSTAQCYYLVACDKRGTGYRILKMDRTLIERPAASADHDDSGGRGQPASASASVSWDGGESSGTAGGGRPPPSPGGGSGDPSPPAAASAEHDGKTTLRRLSEFTTEDPNIYTQQEIRDVLDMIHDGNITADAQQQQQQQQQGGEDGRGGGGVDRKRTGGADGGGGGLKPVAKAYGVVGFIRFLDCYYLTLITKRAKVGSIGGHGIYCIKSTETFPLKPAERGGSSTSTSENAGSDPSSMLLSMWNRGKRSVGLGLTNREIAELRYQGLYQVVDLTKNFFFSYTYDITRSLQENFLAMTSTPFPPPPFKDMYAWNFFLTRELEECTSSLTGFHWVLPIIHGAFIQRKLNDYGRALNLTLLARRSRHFAGTRYLKRGVSDRGKVANDVEHEQILHDESSSGTGTFSSFLQVRGSIPTYWTQESSVTMPKPPIVLNRVDPTYHATQAHFEDLLKRYGSPIVVVDLVKQSEKREREVIVGNEFRHAIDYLNCHIDNGNKIPYCALDYSHISKHRNLNVSTSLNEVATWSVNLTGFFCSAPRWKIVPGGGVEPFDEANAYGAAFLAHHLGVPVFPMEQKGVLRTNCIDCLDRTNVAQFSAGVEALGQALVVMGVRCSPKLDPSSNIVRMLIDMYVEIGDHIALQYGGSEAHKKVSTAGTASNVPGPMGKHKELLTSIRRYYSNAFTDRLKQDAMNLFLGYYVPSRHTVPLWELDSDYYLHNFHVKAGRGSLQSMKAYQRTFAVDWSDDDEDDDDTGHNKDLAISPSPLATRKRHERHASLVGAAQPPALSKGVDRSSMQEDSTEESWRINRVRKRCTAQTAALGCWWRIAIQSYIQQRMWMQLGHSPTESLLPPRFERLYQPEKLAQFDKFFARSWATPMRLSHSAQHSHAADDDTEKPNLHRKRSSPSRTRQLFSEENESVLDSIDDLGDEEESHETSMHDFIEAHGLQSETAPSLASFLEAHKAGRLRHNKSNPEIMGYVHPNSAFRKKSSKMAVSKEEQKIKTFLGDLQDKDEPCEEYIQYANKSRRLGKFRPGAREEFAKCLHETTLDSDDVEGIRRLAESAHIGRELRSGPYRGLRQNESAVEVTTVIHEQFNNLGNMHNLGGFSYGDRHPGVNDELRYRGFDTPGVKEAFSVGLVDRFAQAEKVYAEINDTSSLGGCRRSDLTCAKSMQLYSSFFDDATPLTRLEMTYMNGRKVPQTSSKKPNRSLGEKLKAQIGSDDIRGGSEKPSFAERAASMGTRIKSRDMPNKRSPSLFSYQSRRRVPAGFEQINEDLFARKDNKFMVFNGAGVDSWHGTPPHPLTKVHGIEEDILVDTQ